MVDDNPLEQRAMELFRSMVNRRLGPLSELTEHSLGPGKSP
jgi:hypothetical protein